MSVTDDIVTLLLCKVKKMCPHYVNGNCSRMMFIGDNKDSIPLPCDPLNCPMDIVKQ